MERHLHKDVEKFIAETKARLADVALDGEANAYYIERDGYTIRHPGHAPLRSEGAPRHHPVWADDIRAEIQQERRAGIETGPPKDVEWNYEKWPSASKDYGMGL